VAVQDDTGEVEGMNGYRRRGGTPSSVTGGSGPIRLSTSGLILIAVDEIGDPGIHTPDDPSLVLTATVMDGPIPFGDISKKYRRLWKKPELKAHDACPTDREIVIREISALGPEIYAVFIDKNSENNPSWWQITKNRKTVYRRMLSELMDETFSKTKRDRFTVVLDRNSYIKDGVGERIVMDSAARIGKKVIECCVEDSMSGTHCDLIQTNDFIPRETRDRIRGKEGECKLNIIVKRLSERNEEERMPVQSVIPPT
jgi:hypothetical protein